MLLLIPAIDLKGSHCVQLVGGKTDHVEVELPDPVNVARRWMAEGAQRLHIIDLDAALESGDNSEMIRKILDVANVPVQVGGGVRHSEHVQQLLELV